MRTGLTDMLVTDLSQSPDVEVLGSDRLVQILGDMKRLDDRQISFDTVQQIAKRAGVKSVILGSYVKAGDTIRINVKLQEADTGRIVSSERVEAANESSIFATVDDLTKRIKSRFLPGGGSDPTRALVSARLPAATASTAPLSLDRDLMDVSTKSIEAYRYYVEGIDLHNRAREIEAIPLLEKAVQADPTFATRLMAGPAIKTTSGETAQAVPRPAREVVAPPLDLFAVLRQSGEQGLREALVALHPYELPEVLALPIEAGHAPYLAWLDDAVG
jgi:TolB-like protein